MHTYTHTCIHMYMHMRYLSNAASFILCVFRARGRSGRGDAVHDMQSRNLI